VGQPHRPARLFHRLCQNFERARAERRALANRSLAHVESRNGIMTGETKRELAIIAVSTLVAIPVLRGLSLAMLGVAW
jgi:hypothetical protein